MSPPVRAGRQLAAARMAAPLSVALALAGCRPGGDGSAPAPASSPPGSGGQTGATRSTVISTPKPALSSPTLSSQAQVAEVEGSCPYIGKAQFAAGEGDRVGRVTVLRTRPVGCRFYFEYQPSTVVGEIDVARFATATEAYNAMVGSAAGHSEVQSDPEIGAGAVAFRTRLQGTGAWQCVFAKGTSVVTVRTRQPYPALNAFILARVIAPKIK